VRYAMGRYLEIVEAVREVLKRFARNPYKLNRRADDAGQLWHAVRDAVYQEVEPAEDESDEKLAADLRAMVTLGTASRAILDRAAARIAQSTPPPAREIVKIPAIDSELVRRLYAAEEDYTTEWGSGELYGQAADAMRRLIWALHWVATRSTNGLLMAPRDLPMEGFVRDEIAAVDAAPDSAAPQPCSECGCAYRHYSWCMSGAAAQADAPEGEK
jgi:hypothetical protein